MALFSSYVSDFSSGLPSGMSVQNTGAGTATVTDGVLRFTPGNATNHAGAVAGQTGDEFDSLFFNLTAHPSGTDYFNIWAFAINSSYNGMACLVLRNATTVGEDIFPYTNIRIYSVATGVTTMRSSHPFNREETPWIRFRRSGNFVILERAPANGNNPGTWSEVETRDWTSDTTSWSPTDTQFALQCPYSGNASAVVDIDGLNGPISDVPPPSGVIDNPVIFGGNQPNQVRGGIGSGVRFTSAL